jgi:xylan 1,4-beta-xylosidase
MAVVARSTDVMGPWVESPHNPLIWTESASEAWWSKGHATLIEGPEEHWYAIYHGYPNGQRSFGRCTLISPVQWTADGWPVMASTWPDGWGEPVTVEWPLSDEFDGPELGVQWQSLHKLDLQRYRLGEGKLEVMATGDEPGASYPLTVNPKDLAYEVEAELTIEGDVTAGLILFYNPQAYVSLGLSHEGKLIRDLHRFPGQFRGNRSDVVSYPQKRIKLRLRNDRQDASAYYQNGQGRWVKLERSDDISAMQHNLYGGFISIRPGIFAAGQGKATFTYFTYRGL